MRFESIRVHGDQEMRADKIPVDIETTLSEPRYGETQDSAKDTENDPEKTSVRESLSQMGSRAKEIFSAMSDKGKALAGSLYEGINKIPGVDRLVGKMKIAYNQFFIDHHENKLLKVNGELQAVGANIEALERTTADIESSITKLEALGAPGVDVLKQKSIELNNEKIDLLLKQDELEAHRSSRLSKMESYVGERDLIADRLIDTYNEKLKPVERKLESLETDRDILEQKIETTRATHELQLQELDTLDQQKVDLEDILRRSGMSDKEISRFETIKLIDEKIKKSRESIRVQEEKLRMDLNKINQQIASTKSKVAPYHAHKREFENLKKKGRHTTEAENLVQSGAGTENAPEATPQNTPEQTSANDFESRRQSQTLRDVELYVIEGAQGDERVIRENLEALETLFVNDKLTEEFFTDLYSGGFDENQLALMTKYYFETGRPLNFNLTTLEARPLVLSLPNSEKKLQLRMSGNTLHAEIIN